MLTPETLSRIKLPTTARSLSAITAIFVVLFAAAMPCMASVEVDVVTVAAAKPIGSVAGPGADAGQTASFGVEAVSIPIRLSVVPSGDSGYSVRRMVVRVKPRSTMRDDFADASDGASSRFPFGLVRHYSPQTEIAPMAEQPVLVRTTDEKSQASGVSIDGVYGTIGTAHGGLDRSDKTSRVVEAKHLPNRVASISAGTIDRGTGVMFKLDATPHLVIEGERTFEVETATPTHFRGGIVDVEIELHVRSGGSSDPSFWQRTMQPMLPGGEAASPGEGRIITHHFAVSVYLEGDAVARRDAHRVASSENAMRRSARETDRSPKRDWRTRLFDPLDLTARSRPTIDANRCVERVVRNQADPHHDRGLRSLPMSCRTAVLDYVDARDRLVHGDTDAEATQLASLVRRRSSATGQE